MMRILRVFAIGSALVVFMGLSLGIGPTGFDLGDEASRFAILNVRLPRVLTGVAVAFCSAFATVFFRLALRSELADPALFGITGFAALGSIVAIVLGFDFGSPWSFGLAVLATLLALLPIAAIDKHFSKVSFRSSNLQNSALPLIGITFGMFSTALVGLLASATPDPRLRSLTLWAYGSLSLVTLEDSVLITAIAGVAVLGSLIAANFVAKISLGRLWLLGQGLSHNHRLVVSLSLVGLLSATASFATGSIAFIGLVGAILGSGVFGPSIRERLVGAGLVAAILVLAADLAARNVAPPFELPLGVFTALIGAPVVVMRLFRSRRNA
jgi:iron complex transport system permease protein